MNDVVFIVVSVAVAAFVGGITNHYAIKMLFHPRQPVRLFGRRLPFTPGLIPKRREEIGASLGKVVAEYLVTSEGLAGTLGRDEFRSRVEGRLEQIVVEWTGKEETLETLALRWWSPEQVERGKARIALWLKEKAQQGAVRLWDRYELSTLKLRQLVPGWEEGKKEELVQWAAGLLLRGVKDELLSPDGERMLRRMTLQLIDQAGGLFGTLAGIFLDEDKLVQKIKLALSEQLDSPAVRRAIAGLIGKKLEQAGEMTAAEAVQKIVQQDAREWLLDKLRATLPVEAWLKELGSKRIADLAGDRREWLLQRVPPVTARMIALLQENAERLIASIDLPALVERQVAKFPIERLEQIILSVSGKEFRAITWLGVLLGGIIGLIQSLIILWFG